MSTFDVSDAADRATSLGEVYRTSLVCNAATIAAIMAAIAGGPAGTLLVCCTAGKVRTGMVAALLLRLAGVTREGVAEDYALSGSTATPRSCDPQHNHRLIDHVDHTFGGPGACLDRLGLTIREIDSLTRRLT